MLGPFSELVSGIRRVFAPNSNSPSQHSATLATIEDVHSCYRILLGRDPDPTGLTLYGGMAGKITVHQMVLFFVSSPEFKNKLIYKDIIGVSETDLPTLVDLGTRKIYVQSNRFGISEGIQNSKSYEPHLTAALETFLEPGMTFVDIGANIGYFSLLAAELVGPNGNVVSFEPSQAYCNLLAMSAEVNGFQQISIYPLALAEAGTTFLFDELSGGTGVVTAFDPNEIENLYHRTLVRSIKLDDLITTLDRLDAIKIDIDGAEYGAIMGANKLISKYRPAIFTEFYPQGLENLSEVSGSGYLSMLAEFGYSFALIEDSGAVQRFCQGIDQLVSLANAAPGGYIDIVALPDESKVP